MPVISQFFAGAKQLDIDLIEPAVFLRSDATDPSTYVLRGEVSVLLSKPMAAIPITFRFIGKCSILWPEGVGIKGNRALHEKTIHEQELIFQAENSKPGDILDVGLHRWPFQFMISNQLPETIEDDRGKVFYYVIATMHRSGVGATQLRARRDVLLLRTPHWSESPLDSVSSEYHLEACDASIRLEKSFCSSGTQLPLVLFLSPTVKHVFLESISVTLTEKRTYLFSEIQERRVSSHDFKVQLAQATSLFEPLPTQATDIQRALEVESAHIALNDWPLQHRLVFTLPNCYHLNHSTAYSDIHIVHTLKVDIRLSLDGLALPIHFKAPITILDCRLRDDIDVLPTYQEALLSAQGSPEERFVCPRLLLYQKNKNAKKARPRSEAHPDVHYHFKPPPYPQS